MMIQASLLKDECSKVAETIRNVFEVEGDLDEADVESLHVQFVDCIETVNARLKKCDELLRKGLRGEAVQECEIKPRLLDLVAELDIEEWDAWADYVRQFGIPPQPALLIDVAGSLNEAYTASQPLEESLQLHRLHALARSPLSVRLRVLRSIAEKDPQNPVWIEDVKDYEFARIREMDAEYRLHSQAKNIEGLRMLRREITESDWVQSPPPTFVSSVQTTYELLRREHARAQLVKTSQELNEAFSEFNVRRAQLAQTQWDKYAEIASLPDDDPLLLEVSAAFEWLDDEAANEQRRSDYARAVAELDRALDNEKIKPTELTKLFSAVERFDEPIPDRIARRYDERMKTADVLSRRRSRLVLAASVVALVCVGSLVFMVINRQNTINEVNTVATQLRGLMDDGLIEEADTFLTQLETDRPAVAASAPLQKLRIQLDALIADEDVRKQRFRQALDNASSIIAAQPIAWTKIFQAEGEIDDAKAVAKHSFELLEIKEVERTISQKRQNLQDSEDSKFLADAKAIESRAAALNGMGKPSLIKLKADAETLLKRAHVSASTKDGSGLEFVITRVADAIENGIRIVDTRSALNDIARAIGTPLAYAQQLQSYCDIDSIGSRSDDFRVVQANELTGLEKIKEYNQFAVTWNSSRTLQSEAKADDAIGVIDPLKADFAEFPGVANVISKKPYLESVKVRFANKLLENSIREFKKPVYAMNSVTVAAANRTYYFTEPPTPHGPAMFIIKPHLSARDLLKIDQPTKLSKAGLTTHPLGNGKEYGPAAHSSFAKKAIGILENRGNSYELKICGVLHQLYTDEGIDPLLKCDLLRGILRTTLPGSTYLKKGFEDFNDELVQGTAKRFEGIDWLADDELAQQGRTYNKRMLRNKIRQTPFEIWKQIEPEVTAPMPILNEYQWCGFLLKEDGKWELSVHPQQRMLNTQDGKLFVEHYEQSSSKGLFEIGEVVDGDHNVSQDAATYLKEGRLVYFVQQAS